MEDKRKKLARDIISAIIKFQEIERESLDLEPVNQVVIDELIREMVDCNYITIDLNSEGKVVLKLPEKRSASPIIATNSNATFQSSTNRHMNEKYSGLDGELYFRDSLLYFIGKYDEVIFRTSLLVKYKQDGDLITFHTLNSNYIFKLIKKIKIDHSILANQEKIDQLMQFNPIVFI